MVKQASVVIPAHVKYRVAVKITTGYISAARGLLFEDGNKRHGIIKFLRDRRRMFMKQDARHAPPVRCTHRDRATRGTR